MVGESDVHFERPMLADNAISFVKIFDKDAKSIVYDGKVKFDKTALVDGSKPEDPVAKQLIK